jgi:transcriptional regulator with XRE-family HTH domain
MNTLRHYRLSLKISRSLIAKTLNVSYARVWQIESGVNVPKAENKRKLIAEAYNVPFESIEWLPFPQLKNSFNTSIPQNSITSAVGNPVADLGQPVLFNRGE